MTDREPQFEEDSPQRWGRMHKAVLLGPVAISWGWKWSFRFRVSHSARSYRLCVLGVLIEVVL